MERNGIRHIKTAPYHPSSNGLAERSVQTLKENLKKGDSRGCQHANTITNLSRFLFHYRITPHSTTGLITNLSRFLFHYQITPHSTTGLSPAELLLGRIPRIPRSHLDLLKPSLSTKVQEKHSRQKNEHDRHAKERRFIVDDSVFVRELPSQKKWLQGKIVQVSGPLTYLIELVDGRIVRRHVDHIRIRTSETVPEPNEEALETIPPPIIPDSSPSLPVRRSTRISRPPNRYTS